MFFCVLSIFSHELCLVGIFFSGISPLHTGLVIISSLCFFKTLRNCSLVQNVFNYLCWGVQQNICKITSDSMPICVSELGLQFLTGISLPTEGCDRIFLCLHFLCRWTNFSCFLFNFILSRGAALAWLLVSILLLRFKVIYLIPTQTQLYSLAPRSISDIIWNLYPPVLMPSKTLNTILASIFPFILA